MTDETTGATGTLADPTTQPPAGNQSSQADGGNGEQSSQPESISLEEAKKLRAEANSLRKRLKDAEDAKVAAETASLSDTEKAIAQAKKDGGAEVLSRVQAQIRRSETRAALTAAGVNAGVLDLAVKADEFASLNVDDEGDVEGLGAAVDQFRKAHPDLFKSPVQAGSSDGGSRGTVRITKEQAVAWSKDPAEYEKHRDEILAWTGSQK